MMKTFKQYINESVFTDDEIKEIEKVVPGCKVVKAIADTLTLDTDENAFFIMDTDQWNSLHNYGLYNVIFSKPVLFQRLKNKKFEGFFIDAPLVYVDHEGVIFDECNVKCNMILFEGATTLIKTKITTDVLWVNECVMPSLDANSKVICNSGVCEPSDINSKDLEKAIVDDRDIENTYLKGFVIGAGTIGNFAMFNKSMKIHNNTIENACNDLTSFEHENYTFYRLDSIKPVKNWVEKVYKKAIKA